MTRKYTDEEYRSLFGEDPPRGYGTAAVEAPPPEPDIEVVSTVSEMAFHKLYPNVFKKFGRIDGGTFSPLIDLTVRAKAKHSWDQLGAMNPSMFSTAMNFGETEQAVLFIDLAGLEAAAIEEGHCHDPYDCSTDEAIIKALRQVAAWGVAQRNSESLLHAIAYSLRTPNDGSTLRNALSLLDDVDANEFAGEHQVSFNEKETSNPSGTDT